jgi:hypothetical protein
MPYPRLTTRAEAGTPTPTALPFPGTLEQQQQLAAENQGTWKLLDEHRLDPARPPRSSYRRTTDFLVRTTDPDATPMSKGGATRLGYHDHDVVDGGKARIILSAFVTPADVMENQPMLDLLRRVQFRYHLHPQRVIADTTDGTVENIRALEDAGMRASVPLPNFDERTPYDGASTFTDDAAHDVYRCPEGEVVPRRKAKYTEGVVVYQAQAAICNACPVKAACTASDQGAAPPPVDVSRLSGPGTGVPPDGAVSEGDAQTSGLGRTARWGGEGGAPPPEVPVTGPGEGQHRRTLDSSGAELQAVAQSDGLGTKNDAGGGRACLVRSPIDDETRLCPPLLTIPLPINRVVFQHAGSLSERDRTP